MILSTAHFLLHCAAPVRVQLLATCLETMVPWAMHHHHATRCSPHLAVLASHTHHCPLQRGMVYILAKSPPSLGLAMPMAVMLIKLVMEK